MLLLFFRVGNLTFGGGDPTMASLQAELIASKGWLNREEYALIFSLARATPGTNLLAFCAGCGWRMAGWPGAIGAVLAVSVPGVVLVVWFTHLYESFRGHTLAMAAINGTLAAAVGLMAGSAWMLLRPSLNGRRWARAAAIFCASVVLAVVLEVPPIPVLAFGALAGVAGPR